MSIICNNCANVCPETATVCNLCGFPLFARSGPGVQTPPYSQQPPPTRPAAAYQQQPYPPPTFTQSPPPMQPPQPNYYPATINICPQCNTAILTQTNFCPNCGLQTQHLPSTDDIKYLKRAVVGGRMLGFGIVLYIISAIVWFSLGFSAEWNVGSILNLIALVMIIWGAIKRSRNKKLYKRSMIQKGWRVY